MRWRGIEHMPRLYELASLRSSATVTRLRERTLQSLRGRVLEIGAGSGLNLPFYDPAAEVIACDIDVRNVAYAAHKPAARTIALLAADAQALPFAAAQFDHVVSTLVLCSVDQQQRAFAEIARVLRPDGLVHLIEHTISGKPTVDWVLDRIERPWGWLTGGCHPNRDTVGALSASGWQIIEHEALGGNLLHRLIVRPPAPTR